MAITLNTKTYSLDAPVNRDKNVYVGPAQTSTAKDQLTLGRTAAKPSGTSKGKTKSEYKTTQTVPLSQGGEDDIIIVTYATIPVGASDAAVDAARDDHGDFIISAAGGDLMKKHKINP